jgi:hypothetical protein
MTITRKHFLLGGLASVSAALLLEACSSGDDEGEGGLDEVGDGDGDPTTGDGDGDPTTGDGDGDPTTGDGDGDPTTGDGDGDPTTGDGDGDPTTGDGDGDPTTGDGDGDPTTGDGDGDEEQACPLGASGSIADNHGHVLLIPQADILAGVQKVYDIKGNANHSHTVTMTASDFAFIAQGNQIDKMASYLQGHDHAVYIACL